MPRNEMVTEILRRGAVAAQLHGWSDLRARSFAEVVESFDGKLPSRDPLDYGIVQIEFDQPGIESWLTEYQQIALGKLDAAHTLKAWAEKDKPRREIDPLEYATYWMGHEGQPKPEDAEFIQDMQLNEVIMTHWGGVEEMENWFRCEHEMGVIFGRRGYARLILEPIVMPPVLEKMEHTFEIVDGRHRIAAMALTGKKMMVCVVCNVEPQIDLQPNILG